MSKPPVLVITSAHDFKIYAIEDTPQEFIDAIETELARVAAGEYDAAGMEVNADTPDDVLDAFLFGEPPAIETPEEHRARLRAVAEQWAVAERVIKRSAPLLAALAKK